jgi:hypothetical protein
VVVSASDTAGNVATATQTLTVDTVSPGIVIAGGASATTSDPDPTITGTSEAAPGTTVTVSIASQTMTTLVQGNGGWNATPATVGEGTWSVLASASDPAGNVGSDSQALTITTDGTSTPPDSTPPGSTPPSSTDPQGGTTPNTTITTRPPRKSRSKRVTYGFTSSEADSTFECKIDKKSFKPCRSGKRFKVGAGKHGFEVRAIDPAGNVDPTAAAHRFRIR